METALIIAAAAIVPFCVTFSISFVVATWLLRRRL